MFQWLKIYIQKNVDSITSVTILASELHATDFVDLYKLLHFLIIVKI